MAADSANGRKRWRRPREAETIDLREAVLEPDLEQQLDGRARLADVLLAHGAVSQSGLEQALQAQNANPTKRLSSILLEEGQLDEQALTQAIAQELQLPLVDLRHQAPSPEAAPYLNASDAYDLSIVPFRIEGDVLDVIVADPYDPRIWGRLRHIPVRKVRLGIARPSEVQAAIGAAYRALNEIDTHVQAFEITEGPAPVVEQRDADFDADAPVIQVVNKIVTQALRDRSSDVHIEPIDDRVRVRFRIDGALKEVVSLPANMSAALVSRIKIMAGMNIVEKRRPQDGQFQMEIDGRELDVRVSTTSTLWGEKTVLRLLDRRRSLYRLSDLGMPPRMYEKYSVDVRAPFGMVIVSGPTGSGKTTTLYSTLAEINRPDINVMTIEDPVEYVMPSISQIQINEMADVTFAAGLKSILRQDPDVILVGEIRDVETARIAVQSALTGHLVLSSLHSTDSVSALYRLLDMGIEPFLIASSVTGIIAQRLVRRICGGCAAYYQPAPQMVDFYEKLGGQPRAQFVHGTGCNVCSGTGYYDRVAVYEYLKITDEIRQLVVKQAPPIAVREQATLQGLLPLRKAAIQFVAANVTTIDEVMRSVYIGEGAA